MELAFRVPAGVDPGTSGPGDCPGTRFLAFFFRVENAAPVRIRIESFAAMEDLDALLRSRRGAPGGDGAREAEWKHGGFDRGVRIDREPDGEGIRETALFLKRFRRLTAVTVRYADASREVYGPVCEKILGAIRSTAGKPGAFPAPEGFRTETTERFEILTDAHPDLAKAAGEMLEAGLDALQEAFPGLREPEFRRLAQLHGTAEGFAGFRKARGLPEGAAAWFFEDARLVATGPLPKGKQTRRFGRWELDVCRILRCLFEQHILLGLGTRAEPWFMEGGSLYMGLGFTPELEFEKKQVETEAALGIEEALTKREVLVPPGLFETERFSDAQKLEAASWICFFRHGPGQAKKKRLETYLSVFRKTWDGARARKEAFDETRFKNWRRTHGRYFLYLASRAKRRR
jgi:hypothetical protein